MKEPRGESLANHADLESCVGDGDIAGEALTEALAGRLTSREIPRFGCRPCGQKGKALSTVALSQAAAEPGAVAEPVHVRKLPARDPGDLGGACWEVGLQFREQILAKGDSEPPDTLFRGFMGRDPNPEALLERLGLARAG